MFFKKYRGIHQIHIMVIYVIKKQYLCVRKRSTIKSIALMVLKHVQCTLYTVILTQ